MECDNISSIKTIYRKSFRIFLLTVAAIIVTLLLSGECQAVTLTINVEHGSVTVNPAKDDYSIGEVVELITRPNTDYCFAGWE